MAAAPALQSIWNQQRCKLRRKEKLTASQVSGSTSCKSAEKSRNVQGRERAAPDAEGICVPLQEQLKIAGLKHEAGEGVAPAENLGQAFLYHCLQQGATTLSRSTPLLKELEAIESRGSFHRKKTCGHSHLCHACTCKFPCKGS